MATAVHVSLAEYLSTEYEPDCEYLDGLVEERNVGKRKHSKTQALLAARLQREVQSIEFDVLIEQRVQIAPTRFRIPDICLVRADDQGEVIQSPPLLWIEILSPEDRWARVQAKIDDCLRFGVSMLWIIDPYARQAWSATQTQGIAEITDGRLSAEQPQLEISLEEILPEG